MPLKLRESCKHDSRCRRDYSDDRTVDTMDTMETIMTTGSADSVPTISLSWEESKKIASISLAKGSNAKCSLALYVEETKQPLLSDPAGQERIAILWKRLRENEEKLQAVDRTCPANYEFLL